MPPKAKAAGSKDGAAASSSSAVEGNAEAVAAVRKVAAHPPTAVMVREALRALDSRKGVSSQAIQGYIKQKYLTVDPIKLRHLVRKVLKKGIENGTYVRPAKSSLTTGAVGRFRLAPKVKETKPKGENVDPNVEKAPKPKKDGEKKPPKADKGATKNTAKPKEDTKSPKKAKKPEEAKTSKAAPVKKAKAVKAADKGNKADEKASDSAKTKANAKTTKETKAVKVPKGKAAAAAGGSAAAPAAKATGKRGRKPAN